MTSIGTKMKNPQKLDKQLRFYRQGVTSIVRDSQFLNLWNWKAIYYGIHNGGSRGGLGGHPYSKQKDVKTQKLAL